MSEQEAFLKTMERQSYRVDAYAMFEGDGAKEIKFYKISEAKETSFAHYEVKFANHYDNAAYIAFVNVGFWDSVQILSKDEDSLSFRCVRRIKDTDEFEIFTPETIALQIMILEVEDE